MQKLLTTIIMMLLLNPCFIARAQKQDRLLQLLREELRYNIRSIKSTCCIL